MRTDRGSALRATSRLSRVSRRAIDLAHTSGADTFDYVIHAEPRTRYERHQHLELYGTPDSARFHPRNIPPAKHLRLRRRYYGIDAVI